MKTLGVLGTLIFAALYSEILQSSSSADTESHSVSAAETYREQYLTPVVLTGIAAFCALQLHLLIKNVHKQLSKRRKRRARARFQHAVRKVVMVNRIRAKRRSGPLNLEQKASSICSPELGSSEPDVTASDVSPEAALAEPCCSASHTPEDAAVPMLSPVSPSSRQEPFERSSEFGIDWGDSDIGLSAPIASIADSSDDALGISLPPAALCARGRLSPQEARDAFVKLGIEWFDPDARSSVPIASITVTCVATSGDGIAYQGNGPSERIQRPVLTSDRNRSARLGSECGAVASVAGCMPPGLPDSMTSFGEANVLGCDVDWIPCDQASQDSDANADADTREQVTFPSVPRPRSSSQLVASPSQGSGVQALFRLDPCPEAASLSPAPPFGAKGGSPRFLTRASADDARPSAHVDLVPPAAASRPHLAAVSSGRAAPEAAYGSANGSQSDSEFYSANESQSETEAEASAFVESYIKPKATSVKAMSGAAARYLSLRRPHHHRKLARSKEHEALQVGADADIRFKWI